MQRPGVADRPPERSSEQATSSSASSPADRRRRRWPRPGASWPPPAGLLRAAGLASLLAGPLVVALVALHRPAWHPLSDVALIEMRVRDVTGGHPPLIGVYGRFEGFGHTGSHPGPLLFYLLWPVYMLAGSDGWALQLAGVAVTLAASAVAAWLGWRRGGWPLALGVTAVLVLLTRAYGAERLAEPWNPNVAAAWWVVFLLAVWSVLCDDLPVLPVAVFAGTLCAQSHVGYGLLVTVLGAVAAGWLVRGAVRRRRSVATGDEVAGNEVAGGEADGPTGRWGPLRWAALAGASGVALWLPPIVDQVTNVPGNLSVLIEGFRHPTAEQVPFGQALDAWLAHLDASELVTADLAPRGPAWPGLVTLAAWLASAVVAWRRRAAALLRLHAVAGIAAAVGLVSMSRVFGPLWSYLTLWAWGTTAVMVLAVVATLLTPGPAPAPASAPGPAGTAALTVPGPRRPRAAVAGLAAVAVVGAVAFAVDASSAEMPDEALSTGLGEMSDAVVDRLSDDPFGCGDGCRYLVTWGDPIYLGSQGFGMVVELERRGIDAGAPPQEAIGVRGHRVVHPAEAHATIHVAVTDASIEGARAQPGAELLAYVDPYGGEARDDHRELRRRTAEALLADGFDDLAAEVADPANQEIVPENGEMSPDLLDLVRRFNAVYRPSAVFLLPPDAGGG